MKYIRQRVQDIIKATKSCVSYYQTLLRLDDITLDISYFNPYYYFLKDSNRS